MLVCNTRIPRRHHLSHMVEILFFKTVMSAKLGALRSMNCLFLKFVIKYLSDDESTVLIAMMVQNLWAFLFLSNLLKLWRHVTKNTDVIPKMIPRNKFWYGTVYWELLIRTFQSLTNYVKDFTEKSPMDPSTYWNSKNCCLFRVKPPMSIKTIQLICIGL